LIPFITLKKKCALDLSAEIISYWIIKTITMTNFEGLKLMLDIEK